MILDAVCMGQTVLNILIRIRRAVALEMKSFIGNASQ